MRSRVKPILLLPFMFAPLHPFAQMRAFFGRIVNKDDKGIANSFIKAERANKTFMCDANGGFNFKADISNEDTFTFYGQGYDKAGIVVDVLPNDSIIVELKKNTHVLAEAVIGAKGGHIREGIAGSTKSIHNAGCYLTFKDEIAMFLPADSIRHGLLKEINVFITKDGRVGNKFLVHVYEQDATGAPGEEVTDTTLVLSARKGNEWVIADLTNRRIQVKGGLYVSVEWTVGYGNDGLPWPLYAQSNYYAGDDSLRAFYNGQVLGLTWHDNIKPKVYRRYARTTFDKSAPDKWFLTQPLLGGRKRNETITPMMYFTYSYLEK